jgi:outer membrane lipoprotein-sorting protein
VIFAGKFKRDMKYILILIAFFTTTLSFGQDAKAQGILDKASAKIKNQSSFYVEFGAVIKNSSTGQNENLTGKGWVKGNKYSATYGENTIISNGSKTWTVVKEEKTVYEGSGGDDGEGMNPKKLMTLWDTGFKNKYEKEETLAGEGVHVINLYPKNPKGAQYHTITVYISKATNELKKAVMKSNDGTVSTYTLTKFTPGAAADDSKFVFDAKKYPGYKVVKV